MFTVAVFLWAATATAVRCETVELPAISVVDADSCAPTTYQVYVEQCEFPDATGEEINRTVATALRHAIDYDAKVKKAGGGSAVVSPDCEDPATIEESSCETPFLTSGIVSYTCRTFEQPEHGRGYSHPWTVNFLIEKGKPRQISLKEMVRSSASEQRLLGMARRDLEEQMLALGFEKGDPETDERLDRMVKHFQFSLTKAGALMSFGNVGNQYYRVTIPYAKLRGILRPAALP